jgi:tellurite resistance protein
VKLLSSRPVPLASFASVMGIVGLGLAWRAAAHAGAVPQVIGESLIAAGALVFVILSATWGVRITRHPNEIAAEAHVPITASYFGTLGISGSLLAAGILPYSHPIALALWFVSAFGSAALLVYLLGHWIEKGVKNFDLTPAIFIPVVGNATTVYSAVPLGLTDFGWLSFAFALLCWLTLGPITMYRLLTVEPRLPRKMAPQLAVLVSSPAVFANAWFLLTGGADAVFKIFAFKALFFAILVIRLWKVGWGEPYNVAMWGWTFPAAALAGTFERAETVLASPLYSVLAAAALILATVSVVACAAATLAGWIRSLFAPSAVALR